MTLTWAGPTHTTTARGETCETWTASGTCPAGAVAVTLEAWAPDGSSPACAFVVTVDVGGWQCEADGFEGVDDARTWAVGQAAIMAARGGDDG